MSRIQLALNVVDLDRAIDFYSKLFATKPAKVRSGYANFAVDDPLKLVLIEDANRVPGSLNHLGIEVERAEDVETSHARLADAGLPTTVEHQVTCCYARQNKVWTEGPEGEPWELYVVLEDVDEPVGSCCSSTGPATDVS